MSTKAHRVRDSLIKDAAEAQRQKGMLPDTQADSTFWQKELEEFDQRKTEAVRKPKKVKRAPKAEQSAEALRMLRERGAELADAETLKRAAARRKKREAVARMMPLAEKIKKKLIAIRLKQMYADPFWRARMIAAFNEGYQTAMRYDAVNTPDVSVCQEAELQKVLEASNLTFGDWRKLDGPKLMSIGVKVETKNVAP